MIPTTITCAHCGGHDFRLIIRLNEDTGLQCVKHDEHVIEMDLKAQRRQIYIDHGMDPDKA
jgi:hypothetical protein